LNLTAEIAQLATYRRGKVVTFRDFPSHAEALEAAGLGEWAVGLREEAGGGKGEPTL
jgi:hypothetical protein